MSEIIVDEERLVHDLETGLKLIREIPQEYQEYSLRIGYCGLISTGIKMYCQERDIKASTHILKPKLDIDPPMEHVVNILDSDTTDPLLLDASYSQFLRYVGLKPMYEIVASEKIFPDKKVLLARFSELPMLIGKIAIHAFNFTKINKCPPNEFGGTWGDGPLLEADLQTIQQTFQQIWNIGEYSEWQLKNEYGDELGQAKALASHISDGCITVQG